MPNTIVVLGHDDKCKKALVQSYITGMHQRNIYKEDGEDNSGPIKSSLATYPIVQANNFSQESVDLSTKEFEIQEVASNHGSVTESATRVAGAVIYAIPHCDIDELSYHFVKRVKDEIYDHRERDNSDAHAKKYVVLVSVGDSLTENQIAQCDALENFAQSEGFILKQVATGSKEQVNSFFDNIVENTSEPNIVSRILGAVFYGVFGGLTYAFLLNPLARFYIACQQSYWGRIERSQWGHDDIKEPWTDVFLRGLFNIIRIVISPFAGVFYKDPKAIFDGFKTGWKRGVLVGLESPYYVGREAPSKYPRNIIASFIIIGLITLSVLLAAGIFGAAVVAGVGLTALAVQVAAFTAGVFGVTGLSTAAVVAITGVVVGIASSIIYGIGRLGYNIFNRFYPSRKASRVSRGESNSENELLVSREPSQQPSTFKLILGAALYFGNRILGAILFSVLSGLTYTVLANPLARFFQEWQNSRWGSVGQVAYSLFRIFASPVISLVNDIKMFWIGFIKGWHLGFLAGLISPYTIAKNIASPSESSVDNPFFVSKRNVIASLIIIGCVTTAVLLTAGVFGAAVVAGVGLTAITVQAATFAATTIGLTGLSTAAFAAFAGTLTLIAGSIAYGLLYGANKLINFYLTSRRSQSYQSNALSVYSDDEDDDTEDKHASDKTNLNKPNIVSRLLGAVVGGILTGVIALVLFNPVTVFYCCWQIYNARSVRRFVVHSLAIPCSPLISVVIGLFGLVTGLGLGWKDGFLTGLISPFTEPHKIYGNNISKFSRNIKVGLVVACLVTAAVLVTAGVFGPLIIGGVGLTALAVQGTAALASAFGLTGLGTAALTAIAGTAVWLASSLVYGVVYGTTKLVGYCCSNDQNAKSSFGESDFGPISDGHDTSSTGQSQQLRVLPTTPSVHPASLPNYLDPTRTNSRGTTFMQPQQQTPPSTWQPTSSGYYSAPPPPPSNYGAPTPMVPGGSINN